MPLKGIDPQEVKAGKVKMLIYGPPGSGKSWFSISWPKPYLIDTENGCVRPAYQKKLKEADGMYFGQEHGSDNFDDVIQEVKTLATEPHDFKTLIIDSFSHLYLLEAAEAEAKVGSDFGKDRREANKPTRQLIKWINKCDMNIILIAHNKALWVRHGKEVVQQGNTFEGYPKLEYDLDIAIEFLPGYKNFIIKKSRIESLPQGETMPLSYENFKEVYGSGVLEQKSKPISLATEEQIDRVKDCIQTLNIDERTINNWYRKVDVDDWSEMTDKQITGLTEMLEGKIKKAKGE